VKVQTHGTWAKGLFFYFSGRRFQLLALRVLPDFLAIGLAAYASYEIRFKGLNAQKIVFPGTQHLTYPKFLVVLVAFWVLVLFMAGAYSDRHVNLFFTNSRVILRASINLFLGVGFFSYLAKAEFSRSIFMTFFISGVILVLVARQLTNLLVIRPLLAKRKMHTSILIVGLNSEDLDKYTNWIVDNQILGYKIVGKLTCKNIDFEWVGRFDRQLRHIKMDEILLLPGMDTDQNFAKFIHYLQDLSIPINWVPHDSGNLGYWQVPHPQEGLPFLTFKDSKIHPVGLFLKRTFDIVFSLIALVFLSPIFIVISTIILFRDGRPIFFSQKRVGINGKLFTMYKFRTMVNDAEKLVNTISNQHGSSHVLFKNQKDPRITKNGIFLRRYSIDELPQFLNSLLGSISVVGPRPALPREAKVYSSLYERRLLVKPGITGPWQISGRSDLDLQTSVALDLNYVSTWSFTRDLSIILSTLSAVFRKTGAY
jgi:exopolysaccharide biosynthesis polyprenyl glycosylphosphotransferase